MSSSIDSHRSAAAPEVSNAALTAAFVGVFAISAAHFGAALWFGGVTATAQAALTGLVALGLAGAWFAACVMTPIGRSPALLTWVVIAALGLGVLQLWPSSWLATTIAAPQAQWRAELTSDIRSTGDSESSASSTASVGSAVSKPTPTSLDPFATRRDLSLLASIASVLVAATWIGRYRAAAIGLLTLAAIGGAAYSLFGLIQQMTWDGKIYWTFPSPNTSFGSIVNPNNGAGYLTLCVAASLGVVAWAFGREKATNEPPLHRLYPKPLERWLFVIRREVAELTAWKLASLVLLALTTAGVFCTLSRGGAVSVIGGTLLTTIALVAIRRSAVGIWGGLATITLGIAITAWVGMYDRVRLELLTLQEEDAADVRLELWQSVLPIAERFGGLGTGFGTFRHVNRSQLEHADVHWFYHAENQYVEALIDGGWIGLSLLIAAVAVAAWGVLRAIRDARTVRGMAIALAATFALTSQALHATFDFGLYLPANSWLLAALLGIALGGAGETALGDPVTAVDGRAGSRGRSRSRRRSLGIEPSRTEQPARPSRWSGLATLTVAAIVVSALSWGWVDSIRAARLEQVTRAFPESFDDLPEILAGASGRETLAGWARELRPRCVETDSVDAWILLSEIWTAAFRNQWLERLAPADAEPDVRLGLARMTDLLELHRRVHVASGAGGAIMVREVIDETGGRDELLAADQALRRARLACPVRPRTHLRLAQVSVVSEPLSAGPVHLARALELAPQKASFQFFAGLLDLHANRPEVAQRWRRALELDRNGETPRVLRAAMQVLPRETIVEQIVPTDPAIRLHVALRMSQETLTSSAIRSQLIELADRDLQTRQRTPEEAVLWAKTSLELGRPDVAVSAYDEALAKFPHEKQWRYELAGVLFSLGDLDRARKEIDRVITLDNDWSLALRLRDRIRKEANRKLRPASTS